MRSMMNQIEQRHSETPLWILNAKISSDEVIRATTFASIATTVLPVLDLLN